MKEMARYNITPSRFLSDRNDFLSDLFSLVSDQGDRQRSFPHYDIKVEKNSDGNKEVILTLALAGYDPKDIKVVLEKHPVKKLVVSYNFPKDVTGDESISEDDSEPTEVYIHKGIKRTTFKFEIPVDDFMEVKTTRSFNGLLEFRLHRNIPEDAKPDVLEITTE